MQKNFSHSAVQAVFAHVLEKRMIREGDRVIAAVSGGPDSMALLHILNEISSYIRFHLVVAHINHGLRGFSAERDAKFVADAAKGFGLKMVLKAADTSSLREAEKLSTEEAARKVRYRLLEEAAIENGCSRIAVGHTLDDNAETVLMNLIRGSGLKGVSGMDHMRFCGSGGILLIRPLLALARESLLDFLEKKKIDYRTDETNSDRSFLRNRVRLDLMPLLKNSFNPKITVALNRFSSIVKDDIKWIEQSTASSFEDALLEESGDELSLSLSVLENMPRAACRHTLRLAIARIKKNLRRIGLIHIEEIIHLMEQKNLHGHVRLPDGISAFLKQDCLVITKRSKDYNPQRSFKRQISCCGIHRIDEAGLVLNLSVNDRLKDEDLKGMKKNVACFDMDRLCFPLILRNVEKGDRFVPLGASGSQKIKKYLIDHKIPFEKRATCCVILSKDKIIWLVGHRIDDSVKVTDNTSRILKCEVSLA